MNTLHTKKHNVETKHISITMKKNKKFLFSLLSKGQILFFVFSFILVLVSSIALDISESSYETSGNESIDFTVVVDAGHGGLDVK